MEENSDAHMETDVSSTTDDVLETPQVTGSHGDIEMIVVVEELKEEDESSPDQASKRTTPSTSAEASPQKQATPQKTINSVNENVIYDKLSNNNAEPVKSKTSHISLKTSPEKHQLESSDSSKNADTTVSPGKSIERVNSTSIKSVEKIVEKSPTKIYEKTIEKSPVKISQIQNIKSPFKEIKLVTKSPIKLIRRVQEKPLNNVLSPEKSATDLQEKTSKQVSVVKITNAEIKLPEQPVKTISPAENVTNQEKISKTSPNKIDTLKENAINEIKSSEKPVVIDSQSTPSMDIDLAESANKESNLKNQSITIEKNSQQSPAKDLAESTNEESNLKNHSIAVEKKSQESPAKVSIIDSQLDTSRFKNKSVECDTNIMEKTETVNGDDKMDVSLAPDESLTDPNDSQHSMDTEPHNKSISRELKSLINSAKESKIISECTQLTSKMRKSRSQLDSANTSLTLEPEKIVNRRSSNNSQVSNSSEKSDKVLKRSMRSQNPEFANKCKQFLNSLTSKELKDSDDAVSEDEINSAKKLDAPKSDSPTSPKKKKKTDQPIIDSKEMKKKFRSDGYCWRCHWIVDQGENDKAHPPLHCTVCPRSFHYKCLSGTERKSPSEKNWVCPDCLMVLHAEGSDTRSPAMKKTSLGTLCDLLKYALERMMDLNGVEPFMQPVDRTAFPDYDKYVVHPMDLSQMKKNIADGLYGSTEAFIADVQWILHNSIIFNTCEQAFLQSKLTGGARALVRSCRAEMGEIEACPECYAAAHARRATWFTDVCTTPHMLLWAKLKGFPYWPAKGMSVNSSGLVDVRFFGAHDRAWVPAKDCFLFSEKDPNNFRSKRQDILDSMQEAEQHIRNISRKYGKFVYPPFKTQFDPCKLAEQLKMMIPSFEGQIIAPAKDKPASASPLAKGKRRSNSKGSKSSANDGDGSESEDTSSSARTEAIKLDKNTSEKSTEKEAKVDAPGASKLQPPVEEPLVTRKRRRSNLEEARVMTVIASSSPIPEKKNRTDNNKPEQQEPSSSKEEKAHSTTKEAETESAKKKSDAQKTKSKDEEPSSTQDERESLRVTPIKLVALPRTNKQTPKMFAATKVPSNPGSPREEDKTPQKTKPKSDKAASEKAKDDKAKKNKNAKANKSLNGTTTPKSSKTEKKPENEASAPKPKEKKNADDANKSTVDSSKTDSPKPMKERINFDDDTSLAVLARDRRRSNANLPTISSVCSLSTTALDSLTTATATTSTPQTDLIVQAGSDSSIFTPTSTESVLNMKDAVSKLQKLRDNTEPVVGRVGVRAFARMTSPDRSENMEVEIKAEPVDLEEDEVRLSEKMDLMTACKLQPVNPGHNLRDVRISRVTAGPGAGKKTEPRPRARKTFPMPRANEGRSELNGKNSMVYIPIQPPATQPPVRTARQVTPAIRFNVPASTGNNTVNTMITPLKPSTSLSSQSVVSVPTVGQMSVSTVGQMSLPTVGQVSVPTVGQVPTTVHTVPLMTSVNGQWMFSLQPVMSVGGVDNTTPSPLVNGTATPAIAVPLSSTAANTAAQPNRTANDTTPAELPRLQARPAESTAAVGAPPSAGPLHAKIHQNAQKLTNLFKSLMEETIEKADDPSTTPTSLRLQMEQARWRHSQEIDELKHNFELTMAEMRLSFEKDKLRVVTEARRAAEVEFEAALKLAKSKQWCANCSQEAQFYCCWNTSYCDYPCQRAHWPVHFPTCAQRPKDGNGDDSNTQKSRLQVQPDVLPALQKSTAPPPQAPTLTVGGKIARVFSPQDPAHQKASIIVSMIEDNSGNQTMKCVGTYKPGSAQGQMPPLILNKQMVSDESGKKVVTSGGYLIVGATNTGSVITPAARRPNTIQYFT